MKIFFKPKLKLPIKPVENYDYSIILKALILSFAFSLIIVSVFSSNFIINSPSGDKPHDDLIKDIFNELPDAVSKLIPSPHRQDYQDNVAVEVGLAMELRDSQGNLKKMNSVDSDGNLIYEVIQKLS